MNSCSNCRHWLSITKGIRRDTGECRADTPLHDFKWPRTTATDHCARWTSALQFATQMPAEAKNAAAQQLTLDAGTTGQPASPVSRPRRGKPPQG